MRSVAGQWLRTGTSRTSTHEYFGLAVDNGDEAGPIWAVKIK